MFFTLCIISIYIYIHVFDIHFKHTRYACVYVFIHEIYVYMCMYVCMYVCIDIYIYIFRRSSAPRFGFLLTGLLRSSEELRRSLTLDEVGLKDGDAWPPFVEVWVLILGGI